MKKKGVGCEIYHARGSGVAGLEGRVGYDTASGEGKAGDRSKGRENHDRSHLVITSRTS